uniref:Chloride channel CLIC-like protein 1 n=1 Tax=Stegastes partitus TaxID=144197 RepID=A0A3B4ZN31_9TELE
MCTLSSPARMLLIVLVCSLLLSAAGQQMDDEWLDPYDMLNYDPGTQKMRKPAEIAQQPSCNPVFKRFLSRLLKEIQRVGLPTDYSDVFYDAKIRLSRQAMTEIQTLLEGEDRWRTGALDNALSQILVDLKPHDYEAWKWRFEDTFGVELDTVLKIGLGVLIIVAIVCSQLLSKVSWPKQFIRLFFVCFFVSIVWNWFYLYKSGTEAPGRFKMTRVRDIMKSSWSTPFCWCLQPR